jgi:DNA-binding response OmpR family regulator
MTAQSNKSSRKYLAMGDSSRRVLHEEAVSLLNAHRYCAVIIDISFGMDHVRGWAVARRARAFNPNLPVIYITGGNADEWAIQGVPNSVLITKPFAPVQLLTALSQLLSVGLAPATGLR